MTSVGTLGESQLSPVEMTRTGHTSLRPADTAQITTDFWQERRTVNETVSIPGGWERLQGTEGLANPRGDGVEGDLVSPVDQPTTEHSCE